MYILTHLGLGIEFISNMQLPHTSSFQVDGQFRMDQILAQVDEVSPISELNTEIEQKYEFTRRRCDESQTFREEQLRVYLLGQNPSVAHFDGVDYYINVQRGGRTLPFRYRTGFPVSFRMGVKDKRKDEPQIRDEVEFQVHEDTPIEKILTFMRLIGSLGDRSIERRIRVRGNIRYITVSNAMKVEFVVMIGEDLISGLRVSVAEIEIHGFPDSDRAKAEILKHEQALGWTKFRTSLSMSQILG